MTMRNEQYWECDYCSNRATQNVSATTWFELHRQEKLGGIGYQSYTRHACSKECLIALAGMTMKSFIKK